MFTLSNFDVLKSPGTDTNTDNIAVWTYNKGINKEDEYLSVLFALISISTIYFVRACPYSLCNAVLVYKIGNRIENVTFNCLVTMRVDNEIYDQQIWIGLK